METVVDMILEKDAEAFGAGIANPTVRQIVESRRDGGATAR